MPERTGMFFLCRTGAVAAVLAASLASAAQAGVIETRTPLGQFELVEEVSRLGPDETPIMHVNQDWTKLHLRWTTPDAAMRVAVIDDGFALEIEVEGRECISSSRPFAFAGKPDEARLWRAMAESFANLSKLCTRLTAGERVAHAAALRAAKPGFAPAVNALKGRADAVFKGWRRRCTKFDQAPPPSPFWGPTCVAHSAKVN